MPELPPSAPDGVAVADAATSAGRSVAVVLAAGLGTRMRSRLAKVLHPLCGRPLLAYVLDVAEEVTGGRPLVVTSPATAPIRDTIGGRADYALQDDPRGTADAVRAALEVVPQDASELVVLNGDVPLVTREVVDGLVALRRRTGAAVALVSVEMAEPGSLGRVLRDRDGRVAGVVEARDATVDQLARREINAGLYAFDAAWLRRRLPDVPSSPVTGELYLPVLVAFAAQEGAGVAALPAPDDGTLLGVNDRVQLAAAEAVIQRRIVERHQRAGVTVVDPSSARIDGSVRLAEDVTLEPGVTLRGDTSVGRDTIVRTGSQLYDAQVGERCVIWHSVLESCAVEDDVHIGPYAHVRAGTHVGTRARVGNFVELDASRVGAGYRQRHFGYLGHARVGEGVTIGAGAVTADHDGRRGHRTTIGDKASIGCDTILRAPVSVGDGAVTGAGAVVTHDVTAGRTVVGVPAREVPRRSARSASSHDPPGGSPGQPAVPVGRDAETEEAASHSDGPRTASG